MTSIQIEIERAYSPENFQKLILEAIDYGFSNLGNCSKKRLYKILEEEFNIKKEEIPQKIQEFTKAIEEIFGLAAKIIEIQIMKWLYRKINSKCTFHLQETDFSFTKYIEVIRETIGID